MLERDGRGIDALRVALEPACALFPLGSSGLRWRISCDGDELFEASGADVVRDGGTRFARIGSGLANIARLRGVRIVVLGGVDRQTLVTGQRGCRDLSGPESLRSIGRIAAARPWRRDEGGASEANDRLAYCRGARIGHAIGQGFLGALGAAGPERASIDLSVVGVSTGFFGGGCGATSANCAAARRVDILIEVSLDLVRREGGCAEDAGAPSAVALRCLQQCVDRRGVELVSSDGAVVEDGGALEVAEGACWHVTRVVGTRAGALDAGIDAQARVDARRIERWMLRAAGLEGPRCERGAR
jgi:hypothetical protein